VLALLTHHQSWLRHGERECSRLRELLAPWVVDVQHVGSTSVPGLDAKPILDIAVGLDPAHAPVGADVVSRMESDGYEYRGDHGADGGLLFVRGVCDVRAVHVHMVPFDEVQWMNYIGFRDFLRASPERCHEYAELKRSLIARHATDRGAYTNAKAAFIAGTLQLAAQRSRSA
jgi:GrpB-like predicted nucleotidyltransferase (UPF0157 family)